MVGEDLVLAGTKEVAGVVRGVAGAHGLAYIKLQPALAAVEGLLQLCGKSSGSIVQPFKPIWWSPEWGNEEQAGEAEDTGEQAGQ